MTNTLAFLNGNLCRSDLDAFVDLNRIAVDNFTIDMECDLDPQRAFAGSSRTNNGDNGILWLLSAHARENTMRKRITAQRTRSSNKAPMIWLREKRISSFFNLNIENRADLEEEAWQNGGRDLIVVVPSGDLFKSASM